MKTRHFSVFGFLVAALASCGTPEKALTKAPVPAEPAKMQALAPAAAAGVSRAPEPEPGAGSGAARMARQEKEQLRQVATAQQEESKKPHKGKSRGFFSSLLRTNDRRSNKASYRRTRHNLNSMRLFGRGNRRR